VRHCNRFSHCKFSEPKLVLYTIDSVATALIQHTLNRHSLLLHSVHPSVFLYDARIFRPIFALTTRGRRYAACHMPLLSEDYRR